jgi:hypothetical protein
LVDELVAWARERHAGAPLFATQVVVGPRYTAIGAAGRADAPLPQVGGIAHNGAAETLPGFDGAVASAEIAGALQGRPLHELVAFLGAPNEPARRLRAAACWRPGRVESHVDAGAAALNAALNAALQDPLKASLQASGGYRVGDENGVTLLLERAAGRRFAAVGHIPYGDRVRAAAAEWWTLDLEPEETSPGEGSPGESGPGATSRGGATLPFEAAAEVLPRADVVGIGGTALVDGILEETLRACRPDAYVLLVGPSTPLAPVLIEHGVDALSGSAVADPVAVLGQLREPHEGPTPRLRGMRPVTLHRA